MRRLTAELRRLRNDRKLTSRQVAALMDVSLSTVSRMETIGQGLDRDALIELLTLYRVPKAKRAVLVQMLEQVNDSGALDRFELDPDNVAASWTALEREAQRISNYETLLVPGLLQTFPYAQAVFGAVRPPLPETEVVNRTNTRIARQALLRRRSLQFHTVVHEAALHEVVGGPEAMHGQLIHLMEMAGHPAVDLRVLPFGTGVHPGLGGKFTILDYRSLPSIVMVENKVSDLYLDDADDVAAYRLCWQDIRSRAYEPAESAELIGRIASTVRGGRATAAAPTVFVRDL